MAHIFLPFAAVLVLALGTSASRAQVFIVDAAGGPGAQFTSLPAAVAAVPSGAVLRVRAGTYAPFALAQKSLVVLGEDSSTVVIDFASDLSIGPNGPAEFVRLRHLRLRVPQVGAAGRLRIEGALGSVVLEDVQVDAGLGTYLLVMDRCLISDSPNVHLVGCTMSADPSPVDGGASLARCEILRSRVEVAGGSYSAHRGAKGFLGFTGPAGAAFVVEDASLVLVDAQVLGGPGAPGHDVYPFHGGAPGGRGGAAIELRGSASLELWGRSGTLVRGGDGGVPSPRVYPGADGGDGLVVGARAVVLGITPQPGAPGDAQHVAGQAFRFAGGTLRHDPFANAPRARFVGVPALGSTVFFELEAPAGDYALLLLGFEALHAELGDAVLGDLFTLPLFTTSAQLVPASGPLAVPLFVNDLLPPGLALYGQFVTLHVPTGELRLSNLVLAPE
ncbi:MAG: hypothetical protein IPN34_21935 [Planctomycetes bacterium]|nr:hypothetical protein [Planctomycetota bacterium]